MDLVDLSSISPLTREAWAGTYESLGVSDFCDESLPSYISAENAALLFFVLRATRDTDGLFPCGKWASIQHLEDCIEKDINP